MNLIERAHATLGKLLVIRRLNQLEQRVTELETTLASLKPNRPFCPVCESRNIKLWQSYVKDGSVTHQCRCLDCQHKFPFIS